jgi:hypothetical protein
MYLYIDFASLYYFSIVFGTVQTLWYFYFSFSYTKSSQIQTCTFLVFGNIFRLKTCMNNLVKVPPYSKLNFQGTNFFTQNWCNIKNTASHLSCSQQLKIHVDNLIALGLLVKIPAWKLPLGKEPGCNAEVSSSVLVPLWPKSDTKSDTKSERNTCYLIQCNKTYTGSCDPVQKESSSNKTYFVTVRDVGECTVKPVLRGHLWDKIKWPLNRGSIHMKSFMTGQPVHNNLKYMLII